MRSQHGVPREVITLTRYTELDRYLAKFAAGDLGLVILLGRPGTGKSESVKRELKVATEDAADGNGCALHVEGHMQPFGLYRQLWEHRNQIVILDDLDRLYANPDCVRILKPLCNTTAQKTLHWLTNTTLTDSAIPSSFTTTSHAMLIANEWKSLNPNVRALEDRAIILHFCPSNDEVHQKVGEWFEDDEVYDFMANLITIVPYISMRHYCKGRQLRRAGLDDWKFSLAQMAVADRCTASFVAIQNDSSMRTEAERVSKFIAVTKCSRATYFRMKSRLLNGTALANWQEMDR